MSKKSFLFVCYGNTCRSPMAEHLMNQLCSERGITAEVYSRGLFVPKRIRLRGSNHPYVSEEACIVMKELYPSTQIERHIPANISIDNINAASIILTMEQEQRDTMIDDYKHRYGEGLPRKVFALKQYAGFTEDLDIDDPIGLADPEIINPWVIDDYRKCRDEIKACLEHILDNPEPNIDLLVKQNSGLNRFKKAFWELFADYHKASEGN